jgi:trans-2,3-dihydro-3-hydroxyanthranilate isomerase
MKQVDVFTDQPFTGNPLAVILDAEGLSPDQMQSIAREMNLSETTFVLPPTKSEADYGVRIFTPLKELPFAGHPSVGTAHALVEDGKIDIGSEPVTVHQEVGIGILPIEIERVTGGRIMVTMTQGRPKLGETIADLEELARALGISADEVGTDKLPVQASSTGLDQLMVPLRSPEQVAALTPDFQKLKEFERKTNIAGCYVFALKATGLKPIVHARFFIPSVGVPEDPSTGSAAGALGAYLVGHGIFGSDSPVSFNVEQGAEMRRPSLMTVTVHQDRGIPTLVKVGGTSVTILDGHIMLAS